MTFLKAGLALMALTLIFSRPAGAQDVLSIGFDEVNPPFMFGVGGAAKGIYPELIATAFSKMGVPIEQFSAPWPRVLIGADAGINGIGGIYKNAIRETKYDYSHELFVEELYVYTLPDKKFAFKSVNDLAGKSVGVIRGWSYGDAFDKANSASRIKVEEVESDYLNLKKLVMGRVDAIISSPMGIDPEIKKAGLEGKIAKLDKPLALNATYLIFPQKAGRADLLKRFNDTLTAMKADGSYDKAVAAGLAAVSSAEIGKNGF